MGPILKNLSNLPSSGYLDMVCKVKTSFLGIYCTINQNFLESPMFTKREIFALMFTKREIVFVKREILVYSCKKYIRHKETHKMAIHGKNRDYIL